MELLFAIILLSSLGVVISTFCTLFSGSGVWKYDYKTGKGSFKKNWFWTRLFGSIALVSSIYAWWLS